MKSRISSSLPFFLFIASMPSAVRATNRTWVGTTTDWATTSNWTPAAVPGSGDALTFNDTATETSITKSTGGAGSSLSLTFSGTKSFTFNDFAGAGLYVTGTSPISSSSSGNQIVPYVRLNSSSTSNITLTNNGSGLFTANRVMRDSTGKTGDIIITGSGNFLVDTFRRNGTDVANGLQKSGAGTLTITSNMTSFTGGGVKGLYGKVSITGGTIKITSGDQRSLGQAQSADSSWLTLDGGTLQASTANLTINNANTGISLGSSGGTFTADTNLTLTLGGGGTTNIISGTGALTKMGDGVLSLAGSAAHTYSGTTSVSAGSLRVDSTLSNTSGVTVSSGATLQGTGTINTSTTVTVNGKLAPGNSAGTLSLGSLTLASGATYDYEFGLSASDLVDASGALSLGGSTLSLTDLGTGALAIGNSLTLIAYDGTWDNTTFSGLADGASFSNAGYSWMIDYNSTTAGSLNGGSGTNYVTLTVIPEPAALLLGGLGMLTLLRRRNK